MVEGAISTSRSGSRKVPQKMLLIGRRLWMGARRSSRCATTNCGVLMVTRMKRWAMVSSSHFNFESVH